MNTFLLSLYYEVLPALLQVFSVFVGIVLLRVGNAARERWGIEIEARHREALHSALMSGIRAALGRGLTGSAAVDAAITYATSSVPDALAKLDPDAKVITDLAAAKLREALAAAPAIFDLGGSKLLPMRD